MILSQILLLVVLGGSGCNESTQTGESLTQEPGTKKSSTGGREEEGESGKQTNRRLDMGNDAKESVADSDDPNIDTDTESMAKETPLHDEDTVKSAATANDLLGKWKLMRVACPGGSLAPNAQTENMLLADGSELTYVNVLKENDPGSLLEINLRIPRIGIVCAMKQYFKLNYRSQDTVEITTTSDVENNCPQQVNDMHVIEGNNYSTPATYQIQNGSVTLRGKLPIRVTGQACDTGELSYIFGISP